MSWPKRYDIGREGRPYLTRWDLLGTRYAAWWLPRLFLHQFHQSDSDAALHDHPWPFFSIILRGGYWEQTKNSFGWDRFVRYRPLSMLFRRSNWFHRIVLEPGTEGKVWTLVLTGPRLRDWGFMCPKGWTPWKIVADREENNLPGCD